MKTVIRLFALILLFAAAYGGWRWWDARQSEVMPDGIASGNGRIMAVQVDMATKLSGRIEEVLVHEGDLVEPGQLVARMDTRQLEASLAEANARVAEMKQTVEQARAIIAKTESDVSLAQKQVSRSRQLLQKQATPEAEHDRRMNVLAVAKATLGANKAALRTQEFAVKAAEAQVRQIETQISDSILRSPTRGRVLYRLAEKGEVLPAGGKVMTLLDLTDIYMELYLPSRDAAKTSIGADARVVFDVDAEYGYSEPASVSFISPEAQFTPKQVETARERDKLMFRVKLRFDPTRLEPYLAYFKTGIRAVGYVRQDPKVEWPRSLNKIYPADPSVLLDQVFER